MKLYLPGIYDTILVVCTSTSYLVPGTWYMLVDEQKESTGRCVEMVPNIKKMKLATKELAQAGNNTGKTTYILCIVLRMYMVSPRIWKRGTKGRVIPAIMYLVCIMFTCCRSREAQSLSAANSDVLRVEKRKATKLPEDAEADTSAEKRWSGV